jgi:hypothetical protein
LPVTSSTVPITVVFVLPVVEVKGGEVMIGSVTVGVVVNVAVLEVGGILVNVGVDVGGVQPIRLKVTKNVTETKPHLL